MNNHANQTNIAFIHKGCGGEIVQKSCPWDDNFNGCADCYDHEFMDGFEIEVKVYMTDCIHCKQAIYEEDDHRGNISSDYYWHAWCTS